MDGRGQISIEVVFFVAIVVVIVLVFASIMGDQNEQNMVSSAVKLGAENATTNMVITNTGMTPVRVTSVSMVASGTAETVTVKFSGSLTDAQKGVVLNSTNQSLVKQGYSDTVSNTANVLTLSTKRHVYTIEFE